MKDGICPARIAATVLAVQANYYRVRIDPIQPSRSSSNLTQNSSNADADSSWAPVPFLLCTRRSRLKKIGQQVMVGDRVLIVEPDWQGERGAIAEVLPRDSELSRPPIANVNQILLVFALAEPGLEPYQLSRFLIKAETTGLDICLCLNKSDLVASEHLVDWQNRLHHWGYPSVSISVQTGHGLAGLRASLEQKVTVISGPSGVGKSSLINYLIPTVDLRVGAVSGKLGRGRHTTRHVELFELPTGGLLADTPGFNQPDLDTEPEMLANCFPEARQRLAHGACQFSDCLHRDEPNCVVRGDWERYTHYLQFLQEAIDRQAHLHQQSDPDASLKVKMNRRGQTRYEPRLEAKRYRRPSRRTEQQALQSLYQETDL
ncbi:ribosome small subunit-dependent GTPase A [Leptolyngbya sp. 'hensonii']|uniref:small ribosomal subunit biogenesis GTPase RsgA n=1 Tax=Leptolyngbya sp. 'hensonii' TaxID=1922337 RepID=UPI00094FD995|nr:small ribosomal subunit biogenesis GTPase RsgA [Leptolyngbya sp. 'hensonii']OLP16374.1 ribosome small subunit-dependent GTPase A [Leptolyngbya sp. 'hensonii']